MQLLNKMRRKYGFKGLEKKVLTQFLKRRVQGTFVGHHDRTRAIAYIAKIGIVRGKSRTKQTLSDAWEPMNLED